MINLFYFSSRRRHTRSYGDWSSDVCSSDLASVRGVRAKGGVIEVETASGVDHHTASAAGWEIASGAARVRLAGRSEERRVGKECRTRWWAAYFRAKKLSCTSVFTSRDAAQC